MGEMSLHPAQQSGRNSIERETLLVIALVCPSEDICTYAGFLNFSKAYIFVARVLSALPDTSTAFYNNREF